MPTNNNEGGTMRPCIHRKEFGAINRGIVVLTCLKKSNKMVNEVICADCTECESGEMPEKLEVDYLRRGEQEVKQIFKVCSQCPLFRESTQTCDRRPGEIIPVDIIAQNPSEHCPEQRW